MGHTGFILHRFVQEVDAWGEGAGGENEGSNTVGALYTKSDGGCPKLPHPWGIACRIWGLASMVSPLEQNVSGVLFRGHRHDGSAAAWADDLRGKGSNGSLARPVRPRVRRDEMQAGTAHPEAVLGWTMTAPERR